MTLQEAIEARHSVRAYNNEPLADDVVKVLEEQIAIYLQTPKVYSGEVHRFRSSRMKLKKRKIKYAAIFFLCWVDFFGSYILVEIALLLLVILPTWTVYKFTEER